FLLLSYADHRDLHAFPTRRSSDLIWWSKTYGLKHAAYLAYFHVTMAFNNAGISLYEHSLIGFVHDPISLLTISLMIALGGLGFRSEEHTSELQSRENLVCRLLLEK